MLRRWPLVAVLAALTGLIGFPLVELVRAGFADPGPRLGDALASTELHRAAAGTLGSSVAVTVLTLAMATAAVLTIETGPRRLRAWLRGGVLLPLLIPPFVSALSWVGAYGPGGVLDDVARVTLPGLFGIPGVVAVITVNAVPLAYLVVAAAHVSRRDADLELAARNAGARPATVFRTVTLPAIRPALIGAAALVFVFSINAFGVPIVLGTPSGFTTVTTRIYGDLAFSADPAAFARVILLALLLVAASFLSVGMADLATVAARRPLHRVESAATFPPAPRRRDRVALAVVGLYTLAGVAGPLVALVLHAVTRAAGLSPVPSNWTTANFAEAWSPSAWQALGTSVVLAALAASGVLGLAAVLIGATRRYRAAPLATVAALTFAVPGSALAVAMLMAYGSWLRDTVLLILLAYLAKFWTLGHRPLAGAVISLSPDLLWAARASGAAPATVGRTILVPLLGPAVLASWFLVFLFGLHELTMSSLLYGPETATLAVVTLNMQQLGDANVTSALAVGLTVLVGAAAVPLAWVGRAWVKVIGR